MSAVTVAIVVLKSLFEISREPTELVLLDYERKREKKVY